jgi:hypothetical protein
MGFQKNNIISRFEKIVLSSQARIGRILSGIIGLKIEKVENL